MRKGVHPEGGYRCDRDSVTENIHKRWKGTLTSPQGVLQILEGVLRYEERYAAGRMPYDQYTRIPSCACRDGRTPKLAHGSVYCTRHKQ